MTSLPQPLSLLQSAELLNVLERFGLPIALLVVVVLALFRTAGWLAPRIDRLFSRHEQLLDKLEDELQNHGVLLTSMERTQEMVLECLSEMKQRQAEIEAHRQT